MITITNISNESIEYYGTGWMNDKIARFAVGSISPYFVSTSFKIQVQNIKAQASGVLELFLFLGKPY